MRRHRLSAEGCDGGGDARDVAGSCGTAGQRKAMLAVRTVVEAVNQRSIPRVIAVPWHTLGAGGWGPGSIDCQAAAIRTGG